MYAFLPDRELIFCPVVTVNNFYKMIIKLKKVHILSKELEAMLKYFLQ